MGIARSPSIPTPTPMRRDGARGRRGGADRPGALGRATSMTAGSSRRARRPAPRRCIRATASCPRTPSSPRRSKERGHRLHRPDAHAPSPRWATRSSPRSWPRRRRRTVPGYVGEIEDAEQAVPRSPRDRLPGDDQGLGRRRRQGHAHRLERRGGCATAALVPQRGALQLRRRPRVHREVHRGAAPHRDPGAGRRARQRACTWASANARSSAATRR